MTTFVKCYTARPSSLLTTEYTELLHGRTLRKLCPICSTDNEENITGYGPLSHLFRLNTSRPKLFQMPTFCKLLQDPFWSRRWTGRPAHFPDDSGYSEAQPCLQSARLTAGRNNNQFVGRATQAGVARYKGRTVRQARPREKLSDSKGGGEGRGKGGSPEPSLLLLYI